MTDCEKCEASAATLNKEAEWLEGALSKSEGFSDEYRRGVSAAIGWLRFHANRYALGEKCPVDHASERLRNMVADAIATARPVEGPVSLERISDLLALFPRKDQDAWEWDLTEWSHQYLWCCHAIRWAIAQYDGATGRRP